MANHRILLAAFSLVALMLLNACKSNRLTTHYMKPESALAFSKADKNTEEVKQLPLPAVEKKPQILPEVLHFTSPISHSIAKVSAKINQRIISVPFSKLSPRLKYQEIKSSNHTNFGSIPFYKAFLFSLIVIGLIVLATVLVFQLTSSLSIAYFAGGMLLLLAVVGSIIILT